MGSDINTEADEHFPTLSPDGKFIMFTSNRPPDNQASGERASAQTPNGMEKGAERGESDIYWVDARIIDKYR